MEKTIEDLRRENSRLVKAMNENVKSVEMWKLEIEDLTNTIKMKDRELSDKLHRYESEIEELRKRNDGLREANHGHVPAQKYTEAMRIEKENLEEELKKKNKKIEKLNAVLVEKFDENADFGKTIKELREKCLSLKESRDENLGKLAFYKARLEEHQEEVRHLAITKQEVVVCCQTMLINFYDFIKQSILSTNAINSTQQAEELKRLEEELSKMNEEKSGGYITKTSIKV